MLTNMTQEGRRSNGYIPFMRCSDPRGVVEPVVIRKQKKNHVVNSLPISQIQNNEGDTDMGSFSESAEKRWTEKSAIDDQSEQPSSSSRQSLDSFLPSSQNKEKKKSNLIDWLFGRKVLNQQKAEFDPDPVRKRGTFDQIIESLKLRGNTKSSVLNGVESSSNPDSSNSNHWLSVVQMKPSTFSCLNQDNPIIPKPRAKVDDEIMFHKLREEVQNEIPKSEQNWPKNVISLVNVKQVYEEECGRESQLRQEDSNRLIEIPSQIEITDYFNDDQSSSAETPLSVCYKEVQEEEDYICVSSIPSIVTSSSLKVSTNGNKLKELLISSPSFINCVEEYFDAKGNWKKDMNTEPKDQNARMLVDLANELIELHGYEYSRACLPRPSTYNTSSVTCSYTSLDLILDQISEEIESYESYVKDAQLMDNVLLLVREDFSGLRKTAGVWDIGWRNLRDGDEIEEITKWIDQIVLDDLIQEILLDLTV